MKVREHKFPNETLDLFLSKRLDAKWVLERQELGHFQTQQLTTHQCSITYTFFFALLLHRLVPFLERNSILLRLVFEEAFASMMP